VHYLANLQSVHVFRCYNNIAPKAKCQRVLVLALCLVFLFIFFTQAAAVIVNKKDVYKSKLYGGRRVATGYPGLWSGHAPGQQLWFVRTDMFDTVYRF